jgi:hypothetical protein
VKRSVILSEANDLFRAAVISAICATAFLLDGVRLSAQASPAGTNLQVYLMTMGPGAEIYERFGHNAVWIRDTVAHVDIVYNYGMFSFGSGRITDLVTFGARFAMGPQQYWLGYEDLDNTLALYHQHQRNLDAQELNLTPAQRADLADRLAVNALEANRYYAYDYFRDNCSTRVRDILDLELGGALKRATQGKPAEGTFRFHTLRSIANDKLLFLGINAAFGPWVDRPIDQWDEMFLPAKVQQRVRELMVTDPAGIEVPLVKREISLLSMNAYHVESTPPRWGAAFFAISLLVAGLIRLTQARGGPALVGRVVGGVWMLLMGLGGLMLLFFWIFTAHIDTWANWHLLLLSPPALALISSFWYRDQWRPRRWVPRIAMALMVSVAIGALLAFLPGVTGQQTTIVTQLTALPTFVAALEALRGWNRRRPRAVVEGDHPGSGLEALG